MEKNTKGAGVKVGILIGRGDFCECDDCPVLYGDTCPFDELDFRAKWSRNWMTKREAIMEIRAAKNKSTKKH